eukprot:TRINITY_DN9296_c0_g1_i4.p1 TRINITY_DN9296_c0_g1~~TRINITY_DN9296_c0_g1_i4.p1  ORF type:complete len:109 (+),score=15.96 TRINITY_DN9296_c0_g1_i4:291-617(+)
MGYETYQRIMNEQSYCCAYPKCPKLNLIILDYDMPFLNGIELAEKIQEAQSQNIDPKIQVPIIIASAYDRAYFEERGEISSAVKEFLVKPLTDDIVGRLLKRYLARKY